MNSVWSLRFCWWKFLSVEDTERRRPTKRLQCVAEGRCVHVCVCVCSSAVLDLRLIGFEAAQCAPCCCRFCDAIAPTNSFKLSFSHHLHSHADLPVIRPLCRTARDRKHTQVKHWDLHLNHFIHQPPDLNTLIELIQSHDLPNIATAGQPCWTLTKWQLRSKLQMQICA